MFPCDVVRILRERLQGRRNLVPEATVGGTGFDDIRYKKTKTAKKVPQLGTRKGKPLRLPKKHFLTFLKFLLFKY
jgi:hypothetical protein